MHREATLAQALDEPRREWAAGVVERGFVTENEHQDPAVHGGVKGQQFLRVLDQSDGSARDIISRGFDEKTVRWVQRRVDLNEYKREQAAPGLKVTSRAFGIGRKMPIAQKYVD
jgi:hypothetical protein